MGCCNNCNKLQCNKCGNYFDSDLSGTTRFKTNWGYESTGKDTLTDQWVLCRECTNQLDELNSGIICAQCHKSIIEVMAYLSSENPRCSFYLKYEEALNYWKASKHCGLEFAEINGKILCEICYEALILSFKFPPSITCYMGMDPDVSHYQGVDRIKQSFAYVSEEDALRFFYEDRCDRNTILKIRQSDNKNHLIENFRVEIFKERYRNDPRSAFQDEINFSTGDGCHYQLPCKLIQAKFSDRTNLDLTKPKIEQEGACIRLGEAVIDSLYLIQEAIPNMAQRKLKEEQEEQARKCREKLLEEQEEQEAKKHREANRG